MDDEKDQMFFVTQAEYDADKADSYLGGCLSGAAFVFVIWFAYWLFSVGSF